MFNKYFIGSYCRSKNKRFEATAKGCYLCWSHLSDVRKYQAHMKLHENNVKVNGFNSCWKSQRNVQLIELNVSVQQSDLSIKLTNKSNNGVKITQVAVYNNLVTFELVNPEIIPVILATDGVVTLKHNVEQLSGQNHIAIVYETTKDCETVQSYRVQKSEKKIMVPRCNGQFVGPLTSSNYFDMQSLMIQIEDYGMQLTTLRSTKRNRSLENVKGNEYILHLHHAEGHPLFVLAGDLIWIVKANNVNKTFGFVRQVTSNFIRIEFQTSNKIVQHQPIYSIHFELNRLTFKLQRLALDIAKERKIIELIFPQRKHLNLLNKPTIPKLDICNKRLKEDASQMEAVHHIVAGTAYPLPYVLIGFPGTGKTATIVESIFQLWKINTSNRILVCAQSNSVCDEIAERLITFIPKNSVREFNMIRLFAASVRKSCTNDDLLEYSNFDERRIPPLQELYKYRVIISTLTVSGRLLQANISPNHFTHLFIDECESASEAFTLLPIALCSAESKINAHIVLSGDPNQLGPVVRENGARRMTMDVSMLKRLTTNSLYQKNEDTNSYDGRITCRLRNNYRSHSDLVKLPNELFYYNEMRSCANIEKLRWLSELDFLPMNGFPILFEHVEGIPETKNNCSSWYNETEVESVLFYIHKLLGNESQKIKQSDIGVIAAYKRQVIHIAETLDKHNYNRIEVGTVEQFQGREKPIIIISTVRNGSLGFLQERERINVLLTRAIGLLIIIGHKKSLQKNEDWRKVMQYTSTKCAGEIVADYSKNVGDYRV